MSHRSDFTHKDLLLVTHDYATFTKDQIEVLAPHFRQITVLVRCNAIIDFLSFLPIRAFQPYSKHFKIDLSNVPANVTVIPLSLPYLPTETGYKRLGERHYHAAEATIRKLHIRFDLIHAHFAWSTGYVGVKLKEKFGVPLFITAHGYDIYDLPFRDAEWQYMITSVLNAADAIITVSKSNLRCIEKLKVIAPVHAIPNGFKRDVFHPLDGKACRRQIGLPIDERIILAIGNLGPVKGHKYLVDAMRYVCEHRSDTVCVIVGSGELRGVLTRQIRKLQLDAKVILVGWKSHAEIPIWMNACDVFAQPSIRESFGLVQLEALACGKPVVSTVNGGSEEIIISDDYGLLVAPGDSKALAEGLLQALDIEWDRDLIVDYALSFEWEDIVEQILSVYSETVG